MIQDIDSDRLTQGVYLSLTSTVQRKFRGCMIGCLLMAHQRHTHPSQPSADLAQENLLIAPSWHDEAPTLLGIPQNMAELWDILFEWLPSDAAPHFAVNSLTAARPGTDLTKVPARLAHEILTDQHWGIAARGPRTMRLRISQLAIHLHHLINDGTLPGYTDAVGLKSHFADLAEKFDPDTGGAAAQELATAAGELAHPATTFTVFTVIRHLLDAARALIITKPDTGIELWAGYQSWVIERLYKLSLAAPKVRQS